MIPLKVKWFRNCARARLCSVWIAVKCGLHREAPPRFRIKFAKAAGWLEATLELMTSQAENQDKAETTRRIYWELQDEVESLQSKSRQTRDNLENIKIKFVALLELCGIKDADIPVFDDPNPVRHNRQTLISSFGTMSKKSPHSTPRRSRHVRRDPSIYADMLIEQLLLAHASTDSDTSPPRTEDPVLTSMESDIHKNNNNNKVFSFDLQPPNQGSSNSAKYPSSSLNCQICHNLEIKIDSQQNTEFLVPQGVPLYKTSSSGKRDKQTSHNTTDSGMAGSDHSLGAAACSCGPAQQVDKCGFNTAQNRTSGSTPELPTSESSTSLDIPFASMCDFLSGYDKVHPMEGDLAPELLKHPSQNEFSYQNRDSYITFPVKYCHAFDTAAKDHRAASVHAERSSACRQVPHRPSSPFYDQDQSERAISDQEDFVYFEPLVVSLPPETGLKSSKVFDRHDLNIDKVYKPHIGDKNADDILGSQPSERPPVPPRKPLTDPRNFGNSRTVVSSQYSETKLQHSNRPSFEAHSQCSSCRKHRQMHYSNSSVSGISYDYSPWNTRSQHQLPSSPQNIRSETGQRHKDNRRIPDYFVTIRSRDAASSPEVNLSRCGSASKRRKGNNKVALPTNICQERRTARQRLLFTSPTRLRDDDFTSSDSDIEHTTLFPSVYFKELRKHTKTGQLPSSRKLKENKTTPHQPRSPRQALTELYNIKQNDSNTFTTSYNGYTTSSDTSPELCLPSREEELRERDAYYSDFTVDRQHKIDDYMFRKCAPSSNEDNESQCTPDDPSVPEILTRKVEGAECSPSSFVFRAPPSNLRAPRSAARVHWLSGSKVTGVIDPRYQVQGSCKSKGSTRGRPLSSSSQDYPQFSSSSSSNQPGTRSSSPTSRSSSKSRSSSLSSKSSKLSTRKTCTTHPIASSTLILESSPTTPERDLENTRLLPPYDEPSPPHSSGSKTKGIHRPRTLIGKDNASSETRNTKHTGGLEISAMVSRFEETRSRQSTRTPDNKVTSKAKSDEELPAARSVNSSSSSKYVLAAAQSFLKSVNNGSQQNSDICSGQATTSSMFLNFAKASIICTSSEGSDAPDGGHLYYELSHSKQVSASEPNLRYHCTRHTEEGTSSLVPTDTDTTPESIEFENRPDIPGASNSSGSSSSCTAARCRPRVIKQKLSDSAVAPIPLECTSLPDQDLLDSILTDSPKSVCSSGIYAPHNSYNSPIESVGSHNGYSSTVSSSISTDTNNGHPRHRLPAPPQCHAIAEKNTATCVAGIELRTGKPSGSTEFKRPFTPAPHIDHTRPITRNQGVSAHSDPPTPHRPMSVQSDPLSIKSMFVVPPGVVTGPPKIKDKNSLVRKFKKFSSNFYKKTEKVQTLANL